MGAGGRDMYTIIKYIRHYRGYSVANRPSDLSINTAPVSPPSRPSVRGPSVYPLALNQRPSLPAFKCCSGPACTDLDPWGSATGPAESPFIWRAPRGSLTKGRAAAV